MARVSSGKPGKNSVDSEEQCNDKVAVNSQRQSPEGHSPALRDNGGSGAATQDFP